MEFLVGGIVFWLIYKLLTYGSRTSKYHMDAIAENKEHLEDIPQVISADETKNTVPYCIITSPHSKDVDLGDDDKKIQSYMKSISQLDNINLYIESSNIMSAIHNLKYEPVSIHPLQKHAVARDLNTKIILIGISVIGPKVANNAEKFLELTYELDEEVNKMNLSPVKHGEQLISLLRKKFRA